MVIPPSSFSPMQSQQLAPDATDTGRGSQAFARHQSWLKAYEQAAEAGRPGAHANGNAADADSASQSDDAIEAAPSGALLGDAGDDAPGAHKAAPLLPAVIHAGAAGMSLRKTHAVLSHLADPVDCAMPASTAPPSASGEPALRDIDSPASPVAALSVFESLRRARAASHMAERCVTVYQDAARLSLTVRDAFVQPQEGEAILRRLSAQGLPAGVKQVHVTVNGQHHHIDLPKEGV
jgi:hypothetical protein